MEWTWIKDMLISVAAITGMALGIWNLITEINKRKVRLLIKPQSARPIGNAPNGGVAYIFSDNAFDIAGQPDELIIEVTNQSDFPITISEIGLHAPKRKSRLAVPYPEIIDGGEWPRKLESRDSARFLVNWAELIDIEDSNLIKGAYAKTSCGAYITGNTNALQSFIKQLC